MDDKRSEFLTTMIGILERLHDTSVAKGEPFLASVLAIAKGEAEDALRHAREMTALNDLRERMSSTTSWRPSDRSAEARDDMVAEEIAA